jgi:hypothetical protein
LCQAQGACEVLLQLDSSRAELTKQAQLAKDMLFAMWHRVEGLLVVAFKRPGTACGLQMLWFNRL